MTGQPDWGTLLIEYEARASITASLFLYVDVSADGAGFHENAVERVALDIDRCCRPAKLRVTGRFCERRRRHQPRPIGSAARRRAWPRRRAPAANNTTRRSPK